MPIEAADEVNLLLWIRERQVTLCQPHTLQQLRILIMVVLRRVCSSHQLLHLVITTKSIPPEPLLSDHVLQRAMNASEEETSVFIEIVSVRDAGRMREIWPVDVFEKIRSCAAVEPRLEAQVVSERISH